MIDINSKELLSSKEASLLWGKHKDYVRYIYNKYPDHFLKGTIRKFGHQLIVTQQGMEHLTKNKRLENIFLKNNVGKHTCREEGVVVGIIDSKLRVRFKNGDELPIQLENVRRHN